jgi:integrase
MSVFKDTNTNKWTCKFRYTTWNGENKQKKKTCFKTKKEASQWEIEFIKKSKGSNDMSLASLIELYLKDGEARLKPTTMDNKMYLINTKIIPSLGKKQIKEITPIIVRNWQTKLMKMDYSQTYLKTIHNQMSAILNYGCKYYGLKENACRLAGPMGKKRAELKEFWSCDDFNKFIDTFKDNDIYKVMFSLLFYSGMRCGEMLALTLNDFDFINNTVSISKNFASLKGKDYIMTPKTQKSYRVITLPQFMMSMVKESSSNRYDYKPKERLFPIPKHTINNVMKRGIKKANVKFITIHYLRHSHASFLIEQGFSPLLVSERLGHENIETTLQTYAHLYPNKQSEVAEKLEEIYQKNK